MLIKVIPNYFVKDKLHFPLFGYVNIPGITSLYSSKDLLLKVFFEIPNSHVSENLQLTLSPSSQLQLSWSSLPYSSVFHPIILITF